MRGKLTRMNPWLEKYRPVTFDDFWQQNVIGLEWLRDAVAKHQVPQLVICVSPYGAGKTSLARVLARRFTCQRPEDHPYNPCGRCKCCKNIKPWRGGTFSVNGYTEFDVNQDSPRDIIKACTHYEGMPKWDNLDTEGGYKPWVICLDELSRIPCHLQECMIKVVENAQNSQFFFCFSDATTVIDPIRERGLLIDLRLPNADEATLALLGIATNEGLSLDVGVARQIAESVGRVPRRCVLALEQASVLSDSTTIDYESAVKACSMIAR